MVGRARGGCRAEAQGGTRGAHPDDGGATVYGYWVLYSGSGDMRLRGGAAYASLRGPVGPRGGGRRVGRA